MVRETPRDITGNTEGWSGRWSGRHIEMVRETARVGPVADAVLLLFRVTHLTVT